MSLQRRIWDWIKRRYRIRSREYLINKCRRQLERRFYRKRYNNDELMAVLRGMGLKTGANVFIHCSWDEFYNYTGSIDIFLASVLSEIGPTGTLAMPSFPLLRKPDSIFDISRTPTGAGLLAETFRHYPGAKRSVNQHSVCAVGPMADYLLDEHQWSVTCWDEKSPYFKLSKINAIIFCFGLGRNFVGTALHCADSVLRQDVPYFTQFFQKQVTHKYRLVDQSVFEQVWLTQSDGFERYWTNRSHNRVVSRYFDKNKYRRIRLSNLTINMYDAEYIINRIIDLGRKGITVYLKPNPKKYQFFIL